MIHSKNGIVTIGLTGIRQTWNPSAAETIELALERGEGKLTDGGAVLAVFEPNFTILHAPEFHPDPDRHGTRRPPSGPTAAIVINFATHTILIAGTRYAGEIKKSIFSALNYVLPLEGMFPMHCAAN